MFRKNKINEAIKNSNEDVKNESFSTLKDVSARYSEKKIVKKLFIKPLNEASDNIKDKYRRYSSYIVSKKFIIEKCTFVAMYLTLFILAALMAFLPYQTGGLGSEFSNLTNFYTALIKTDGSIIYSITPMALSFLIIAIIAIIYTPFFWIRNFKGERKWKIYTCKESARSTGVALCVAAFLMLLMIVSFIIPPQADMLLFNQKFIQYENIIGSTLFSQEAKQEAILSMYKLFGLTPTSLTYDELINEYNADKANLVFTQISSLGSQYSFIFNANINSPAEFSAIGIAFLVMFSVGTFSLFFIIPVLIYFFNTNDLYKKDPNFDGQVTVLFKVMHFLLTPRVKKEKVAKEAKKEKTSFKSYLDKIGDRSLLKNNESSFSSDQTDNTIADQLISKEEIEANQPHQAFLSKHGDWMYHDGEGNYFIAKNDEWTPFELETKVHKAFYDKGISELELDPSKKTAKQSILKTKFSRDKNNKNKTSIELPDDSLDEILKKLDI
ncbi:MAG: hypothetical protein ACRC42_01185 [Mycoplasma sp.]